MLDVLTLQKKLQKNTTKINLKKYIQKAIPKLIGFYLNTSAIFNKKYSGNLSLKIFCKPRKGKIREKDNAYLQNFEKSFLQYENMQIAVYKKGSGATKILLVHGWESNAARWERLNNELEKENKYTLYMLDAPAHGASDGTAFSSPLYAQFLQIVSNKIQPEILIGHSIGAGSIAYCYNEVQNLGAKKIVLMGSPNTFSEIKNTYISVLGLSKNSTKALDISILKKYNLSPTDYVVSKYVKKIDAKVLVLHDVTDTISIVENAKSIYNNLTNGSLKITNGFGHSLQHKTIFDTVINFVNN